MFFESRLFFVDTLIDMGAKIIMCDPHRATVIGLERKTMLRGITMTSPNIRAGVALLIAALSATGKSKIFNIEQIDRGYENIEARLQSLGARIERKIELRTSSSYFQCKFSNRCLIFRCIFLVLNPA